jgi:hypothetical protein
MNPVFSSFFALTTSGDLWFVSCKDFLCLQDQLKVIKLSVKLVLDSEKVVYEPIREMKGVRYLALTCGGLVRFQQPLRLAHVRERGGSLMPVEAVSLCDRGEGTAPIAGLFSSKEKLEVVLKEHQGIPSDLQPCDNRFEAETISTLLEIGWDHPCFVVSFERPFAFPERIMQSMPERILRVKVITEDDEPEKDEMVEVETQEVELEEEVKPILIPEGSPRFFVICKSTLELHDVTKSTSRKLYLDPDMEYRMVLMDWKTPQGQTRQYLFVEESLAKGKAYGKTLNYFLDYADDRNVEKRIYLREANPKPKPDAQAVKAVPPVAEKFVVLPKPSVAQVPIPPKPKDVEPIAVPPGSKIFSVSHLTARRMTDRIGKTEQMIMRPHQEYLMVLITHEDVDFLALRSALELGQLFGRPIAEYQQFDRSDMGEMRVMITPMGRT